MSLKVSERVKSAFINMITIFLYTDINECADPNENNCSSNANCTDTIGSYDCTCHIGYSGNGYICDGKFGVCVKICFYMHVYACVLLA